MMFTQFLEMSCAWFRWVPQAISRAFCIIDHHCAFASSFKFLCCMQAQERSMNGMVSLLLCFAMKQLSGQREAKATKTKGRHFRSLSRHLHLRSVACQVSPSHLRFMRPIRLARALRGVRVMRLFRYVGALRTLLLQLGRHWKSLEYVRSQMF